MARGKRKRNSGTKGTVRKESCHGCGKMIDLDAEPFNIFLDGRLTHANKECEKQGVPSFDKL